MMRAVIAIVIVALTATAAADRKKAERWFAKAEKAYRAQNFLAAAQYFDLAYKELPAPEIAFSAGQAYRRAFRVDTSKTEFVEKAIKYYEIYLDAVKSGGRVGDAADSLEDMYRERTRLGGRKSGGDSMENKTLLGVSVTFADEQRVATKMREIEEKSETEPEVPVKLTIDGTARDPDTLHTVEPGDHVVRAEAPGYEPLEKRVRVIAGAQITEDLVLQPLPAEITVTTEDGATIIVDGRGIGEAPVKPIRVEAGKHVITVLNTGRRAAAKEVTVTRAEKRSVVVPLQSTLRRRSVKWVAIGAGAFVVIGGLGVLGAMYWDDQAVEHRKKLIMGNQDPQVLSDYYNARDYRDRSIDGVWVTGGAALAIGLTAAWLYYFDSPSAEGVTVVPHATENSAGGAVLGRF